MHDPLSSRAGIPASIFPLVRRHAEDAAFYWQQIDISAESSLLTLDRLRHFDTLLAAHLEGLEVAEADSLPCAQLALERWRKPGEVFVSTWLALRLNDRATLDQVGQACTRNPEGLLRGAICALARLPLETAAPCLAAWSSVKASPISIVAALRAAALRDAGVCEALDMPPSAYLQHPDAHVRAAACRAMTGVQNAEILDICLQDPDPSVRAEAAIARSYAPDAPQATAILWRCVLEQAQHTQTATGWNHFQAWRRLGRWLRHLARIIPPGHPDLPQLYGLLPPRAGLCFALQHGDPAHLPWVLQAMADPQQARYAGWVWQALSGIDLREEGLTCPEPTAETSTLTDAREDGLQTLPLPDLHAVRAAHASLSLNAPSVLLGQPRTPHHLLDVLYQGPQSLRALAALALGQLRGGHTVQVRAPFERQSRQLTQLTQEITQ